MFAIQGNDKENQARRSRRISRAKRLKAEREKAEREKANKNKELESCS
jgi:hypothetical protein